MDRITVVNPRVRNRKAFEEIVQNIAELGLKRPITVWQPAARLPVGRVQT
jgi:ParB family chromosome partitioning protein